MKKIILAVAFASVFAAGAIAQSVPPRDPPFGKGNAGNDTMHEPSSAGNGYTSNQSIPPRDPPFGKGNASNDTMHEPNSAGNGYTSNQSIPPRDPPFGKGM